MSLREDQSLFARKISELIAWAFDQGYELTLGDAYRDPRAFPCKHCFKYPYSGAFSKHKDRLALDLNLFINGCYRADVEAHRPIGEHWETMGGTWGGRFKDGNHYSWGET